jgi:hypothetical protein
MAGGGVKAEFVHADRHPIRLQAAARHCRERRELGRAGRDFGRRVGQGRPVHLLQHAFRHCRLHSAGRDRRIAIARCRRAVGQQKAGDHRERQRQAEQPRPAPPPRRSRRR